MSITKEKMLDVYATMKKIRMFEDKVAELFAGGKLPGFVHLYAGEEAIAGGVCSHLSDRDYITSTHRGHGHCIAKGVDIKSMMAEVYGKATGACNGKGGSMHIADIDKGMLGANGIVGAGGPLACGSGLMAKTLGTDQVTVCFFGDGASEQGTMHEAMNLACCWNLPTTGTPRARPGAIIVRPKASPTVEWPMTCPASQWMAPTCSLFMKRPKKPLAGPAGAKALPLLSVVVFVTMATLRAMPYFT
jgi:hypothetical protein